MEVALSDWLTKLSVGSNLHRSCESYSAFLIQEDCQQFIARPLLCVDVVPHVCTRDGKANAQKERKNRTV